MQETKLVKQWSLLSTVQQKNLNLLLLPRSRNQQVWMGPAYNIFCISETFDLS